MTATTWSVVATARTRSSPGENGNDRLYGDAGTETCSGGAGVDLASATCETTVGVP